MDFLKRVIRYGEKQEREGWPRLVPLKSIYGFEYFLTHERPWRAGYTEGRELMHCRFGESEIIVWYDAKKGTRINSRRAMALWYAYETFHKERIERMMYHV